MTKSVKMLLGVLSCNRLSMDHRKNLVRDEISGTNYMNGGYDETGIGIA